MNKLLFSLTLIASVQLVAMEDVKIATTKNAEKPVPTARQIDLFLEKAEKGDISKVASFLDKFPDAIDCRKENGGTALHYAISGMFSQAQLVRNECFNILKTVLHQGADHDLQLAGTLTRVWIKACANGIMGGDKEHAHIWKLRKKECLSYFDAICMIRQLEDHKRQLFLGHYGYLADFQPMWNKRKKAFERCFPLSDTPTKEMVYQYAQRVKGFDQQFVRILNARALLGAPQVGNVWNRKDVDDHLKTIKEKTAKKISPREDFEQLWLDFLMDLCDGGRQWCEAEGPKNDDEVINIFKNYTDLRALARLEKRLANPEPRDAHNEWAEKRALMDLEEKALLAEAAAQDQDKIAAYAHIELEKLKIKRDKLEKHN